MKLLLTILFLFATVAVITDVNAGHSRGNGSCVDDYTHWNNMINKRSDAPLWQQSKDTRDLAISERVQGNIEKCEELMEEALRMIRKPYPTE
tara:strand:+ start:131 stop:406 length:276 start_codon:yes stop_codon:yes gene_type:complete